MTRIKKGSKDWFEKARRSCIDHMRALLSIQMAHNPILLILRDWENSDPLTQSALHTSCVIAYARPFTTALTKHGKVRYPISVIKKAPDYDGELHTHIMKLRDRIIAHGDYSEFPSTMYMQEIGDERMPINIGINVKGMMGISSRQLAERYEKHLSVSLIAVETALNESCEELAKFARLYPSEFRSSHNIEQVVQEVKFGKTEESIPPPTGPASSVEEPSFSGELSSYRYVTLRHEIPLIDAGAYQITVDGVATEIIFTVDK